MKIQNLFALAAVAAIGMSACEESKPTAKPETKPEAAKPAEAPKPAPTAAAKPKKVEPAEDEVINAPPDAAPAPVPAK